MCGSAWGLSLRGVRGSGAIPSQMPEGVEHSERDPRVDPKAGGAVISDAERR